MAQFLRQIDRERESAQIDSRVSNINLRGSITILLTCSLFCLDSAALCFVE